MENRRLLTIGDLTARIPVIQGGMGVGISLSSLAGNVALHGGVGVISSAQIGFRDPLWEANPVETNLRVLKEEIRKAKEIAKGGIIAANIMVATRFYERYVKAAIEGGIDLIISGAGLPVELPQFVQNTKVKIAPIVSSLKSYEVHIGDLHYDEEVKRIKEDIEIVKSPVGMPGRAIHNAFLDKAQKGELTKGKCHQCLAKCDPTQIPYCITDALVNAAKGNTEEGLLFCGANAYKANKLEHVSDIMREFEEEFSCLQG